MSTIYTVRAGDTFSSIARHFRCSVESVHSENKGVNPKKLVVGSSLRIPDIRDPNGGKRPVDQGKAPDKVKQGDTSGITSKFGEFWKEVQDEAGGAYVHSVVLWHSLGDTLKGWLREIESTEAAHYTEEKKTEKHPDGTKPSPKKSDGSAQTASQRNSVRKHRDEVLQKLRDRLYTTPHVVETSGVPLSRNERKMIVAAVGLCEINSDVFGAGNRDQEFVGRKFKRRGIETSYSRIVHIGLSYGYIQYTQDGGGIGKLLTRMRSKVTDREFQAYFPNAAALIQLANDGLEGEQYNRYGKSGQQYWNKLNKADKEKLKERANTDTDKDEKPDNPLKTDEEIRGARVQKIPYVEGYPAIDLWEDYAERPKDEKINYPGWASAFKAAGELPVFQDAQLEMAVEDYFNPVLSHCQSWNIRSATGLAMVLAGAVRGGPSPTRPLVTLLSRVAKEKLGLTDRFEKPEQELEALKAIANAPSVEKNGKVDKELCHVGAVEFPVDEKRRVNVMLKDEFDFLTEDLYDPNTYDKAHDK
ncbi:MAG: LysM peptidoglycan-binding domain-containing protein [Dechloromonas sp.]|nr:LysM peptidoglycan-binding domain-containing protein [Dechloromonas sp.]